MMKREHHIGLLISTLGVLAAAGCTQQVAREQSSTRDRLAGVAPDRAFEAAQQVFRQYFSIDRVDSAEYAIYSRPSELTGAASPQRVRELLNRTSNRRRETAELRLVPEGKDVIALCHVRVQRLDTSERRAFAPQTGDDRPANNPPFRSEEGASARQREDWVEVGRNRMVEQQVLESLRERLGLASATRPAATP